MTKIVMKEATTGPERARRKERERVERKGDLEEMANYCRGVFIKSKSLGILVAYVNRSHALRLTPVSTRDVCH